MPLPLVRGALFMVELVMAKIHVLDPLVAQRIAAGEVIERPSSVVRELIDNAIDAEATEITIQLVDGGKERLTVIDNGKGISKEDLPLVFQSHATSKVATLEDLQKLFTMGFRGEALYAIASSALVNISSGEYTYSVNNGTEGTLLPSSKIEGTKVVVEKLFETIPARRLFLKRGATEFLMCRNVMIEKAIAFENITFKLYDGQTLKVELLAKEKKERILDVLSNNKNVTRGEFVEMNKELKDFSLYALSSIGGSYRSDRSHIKVYINNRPVDEYSMVQAITYGYGETLPGGAYPYAYLFIDVDPSLVDFNIHPTKREVRLRNKAEIHHQVVVMIKEQLKKELPTATFKQQEVKQFSFETSKPTYSHTPSFTKEASISKDKVPQDDSWFEKARQLLSDKEEIYHPKETQALVYDFRYLGQIFDTFLVVEKGSSLYLIDQHAAHERLLYDQIRDEGGIQRLIVPIEFEVDRSIDDFLLENGSLYSSYGLDLKKVDDLLWALESLPSLWKSIESDVITFLQGNSSGVISELEKKLYSNIACKAAIKANDKIDYTAAHHLIEGVFNLDHPVCPHGRVFVVEVTKESLYKSVGRII